MAYPALLRIRPSRRLRHLANELWTLQTLHWLGKKFWQFVIVLSDRY
jgi:hypothetical protein